MAKVKAGTKPKRTSAGQPPKGKKSPFGTFAKLKVKTLKKA